MNPVTVGGVLLALILAAAGFWYSQSKRAATTGQGKTQPNEEAMSAGFGAQILEKAQNPVKDKLPETNPFQKNTNPLKNVYQNPF